MLAVAITCGLILIALGTAATFWQKKQAEAALQILAGTMSDTQYGGLYSLNRSKKIESLDRAVVIADSLTDENQMHLFTGLAKSFHDLRQWDRALASLEKAEALPLKRSASIMRKHQEAHILVLLALQRGQEALALVEKMLPDYEANLQPDDPDRIFLLTMHARALRLAGRPKEAVAAFESLFERLKDWPSELNPVDLVNAHLSYPIALRHAGEKERALDEARKNIRLAKQHLGLIDQHTARALVQAGNECEIAGLISEAIEYHREAWEIFIGLQGPSDFSTVEAQDDLLRLYQQTGLTDEILGMLRYTVTSFKAQNGSTDPLTLEATERLIEALIQAGKKGEALKAAQESIRKIEALKTPSSEINDRLTKLKALLEKTRR